jgi:hypothetical protein
LVAIYLWVLSTLAFGVLGLGLVTAAVAGQGFPVEGRLALGAIFLVWVILLGLLLRLDRQIWSVELSEDWIQLKAGAGRSRRIGCLWEDLAWFDDLHSRIVLLRVRSRQDVPIATSDDEERARLLDLLVKKGVPRREA